MEYQCSSKLFFNGWNNNHGNQYAAITRDNECAYEILLCLFHCTGADHVFSILQPTMEIPPLKTCSFHVIFNPVSSHYIALSNNNNNNNNNNKILCQNS
jgi:hypothetical protein